MTKKISHTDNLLNGSNNKIKINELASLRYRKLNRVKLQEGDTNSNPRGAIRRRRSEGDRI